MIEQIVQWLKEIREINIESDDILKNEDREEHKKEIEDLNLVIDFFEGKPTDLDKLEKSIDTLEKIKNVTTIALTRPHILKNQGINNCFEIMINVLDWTINEIKLQIQEQSYEK